MDAQKVRALRKRCRMTQVEFAEAVMVHPMTVSKWERGVSTPRRVDLHMMSQLQPRKESRK